MRDIPGVYPFDEISMQIFVSISFVRFQNFSIFERFIFSERFDFFLIFHFYFFPLLVSVPILVIRIAHYSMSSPFLNNDPILIVCILCKLFDVIHLRYMVYHLLQK